MTTSEDGLKRLNIHLETICKQIKIFFNCILTVFKISHFAVFGNLVKINLTLCFGWCNLIPVKKLNLFEEILINTYLYGRKKEYEITENHINTLCSIDIDVRPCIFIFS